MISSAVVAALLALPATPAIADSSISITSHTLGYASETPPVLDASDSRSQVTLYEFLTLGTEDVGVEGLQIDVSGVAGVDVAEARFDGIDDASRARGNLIVGLIRWQDRKRRVSIAVGRQYLFIGAGRAEHLDGLAVGYRLPWWHIDVSAFGGRTRPWQLDYQPSEGDPHVSNDPFLYSNYAVGGRVRFRLLDDAVASVSFVHEGNGGDTVRQNLAFQVGYWGSTWLEALAGGIIDTYVARPQELWLSLSSRRISRLKLGADYRYQVPSLTIPETSLFSVFSLDDHHSATLSAYYAVTPCFTLGAEGGLRVYTGEDTETGFTVAGSARVALGPERNGTAGLEVEWVDASDQWSVQNRAFASYRFAAGIYTTADVFVLFAGADRGTNTGSNFERRLDDKPLSLGAQALAGYEITPKLSAQVAGSAFVTPLAKHDLRLIARVTYRGLWSWGR